MITGPTKITNLEVKHGTHRRSNNEVRIIYLRSQMDRIKLAKMIIATRQEGK